MAHSPRDGAAHYFCTVSSLSASGRSATATTIVQSEKDMQRSKVSDCSILVAFFGPLE